MEDGIAALSDLLGHSSGNFGSQTPYANRGLTLSCGGLGATSSFDIETLRKGCSKQRASYLADDVSLFARSVALQGMIRV